MIIKTKFISSSFDNNTYPKGIACVECSIKTNDSEISFLFVRQADDNTIESFVQNDNLCQREAIHKTIKILKSVENYHFDNYEMTQIEEYKDDSHKKISYKQKVIELLNLLNWNIDKLSKLVQKNLKKKLSELNENEWVKIYEYLKSKLIVENNQRDSYSQKNVNLEIAKPKPIEEEIIKPEEWEEIL